MDPRFRKVVLALAAVGLAISIGVAACGGGDDDDRSASTTTATTTTTTTSTTATTETQVETSETTPYSTFTITVKGGRPVGGIQRPKVNLGDDLLITVKSDVADEIHLHGYDLSQDVKAGGSIQLPVRATVPGRFEIELEQRGVQIGELTVEP
jgi:copper(I)-binding protein